jgi:hypothetical protein
MEKRRELLYDAIIYGLGITLSEYGSVPREDLMRNVGRNIKRYLEGKGVEFKGGKSPDEMVDNIAKAFLELGFAKQLEVKKDGKYIRTRWEDLLGKEAYKQLYDEIKDSRDKKSRMSNQLGI